MSKTQPRVTCDGCGKDLTYTANCEDYYLVVSSASKLPWYFEDGSRSGFVTMMGIGLPIPHDYHFCILKCLDHWRAREHHRESLWRAWNEQWKNEHGTRDKTGRIDSYPSPPNELRETKAREFEAAALAAFPMERPPA